MAVHDITLTLSDRLPVWPGDPSFQRTLALSQAAGDAANVSRLEMGVHTGTHVDAPCHFVAGGHGVESMPLEVLVGPCLVVEVPAEATEIEPAHLPDPAPARVLFKTTNSALWDDPRRGFDRDFVAPNADLARRLVEAEVKLVGVDYLSIEGFVAPGHPVHHILLAAGLVVVEGLDLRGVEPGPYQLYCLPLKIQGSDGAPARVILVS